MRKRFLCPRHKEQSPSAVVYGDGYFCFGCSARGPVTELGLDPSEKPEIEYVEDLADSIAAIQRLPKRPVRGFELHSNDRGFYILWPDLTFYKFRSTTVDTPGGKYRGPSGHRKPPFPALLQGAQSLALVEGEFNALSLAAIEPACDVISPGGAGDFYSRAADTHYLQYAAHYETIYIVADNDAPGAQAGIEAKAKLLTLGCSDVRIHLVKKDFNDLHTEQGKEAVREEARRLGLPCR